MADASMDSDYPAHSPDGLYHIEWSMFEPRMSHWINSAKVVQAATGRVIFDLMGTCWDARFHWLDSGRFFIYLRHYPEGVVYDVWVDPPNNVFRIGAEDAPPYPLSDFHKHFNEPDNDDPDDHEDEVQWTTIEVEMPGGRREQIAVLKGFEEQTRQIYAKLAKPSGPGSQ